MKNESSNMAKEDEKNPGGILSAILDKNFDNFTIRMTEDEKYLGGILSAILMDKKFDKLTNGMTCQFWDDQFVLDVLSFGSGFVTENECIKVRQEKKGKKQVIMDITTPRTTNMKEINQLASKYTDGVKSFGPRDWKKFLNIPNIFDSWCRSFNTSINLGLKCDPVLLYKFLPAEAINEVRHIIQQYYFFCRDYGNNATTITREHTIETRRKIYKVMLQSEFLIKIFLQLRRNFFQSRIQPMRRY